MTNSPQPVSTEEFLAAHSDWMFMVICRDANFQHQAEIRLLYALDVLDVVREELCCEQWDERDLVKCLQTIVDRGGGVFDPADIVKGESDLKAFDHLYGFVQPTPLELGQPPPQIFGVGSRHPAERADPHDLILRFLCAVDKNDNSCENAKRLLK